MFEPGGIRFDGLEAVLGGGDVRFEGRIGMTGYTPGELSVTAEGKDMQLRYPEDFRSVVDVTLTLEGDVSNPLLTGTVTVRDAVWVEPVRDHHGTLRFHPPR